MEHDNSELVQPKTWLIPPSNRTGGLYNLESSPKAAHKCDSSENEWENDDTEIIAAQSDQEKEARAAKMLMNSDREKEGKQVEMEVDSGIGEDKTIVKQALSKREDEQQLINDSHSRNSTDMRGAGPPGHRLPFLTELNHGFKPICHSKDEITTATTFANPLVTAEHSPPTSEAGGEESDSKYHSNTLKMGLLSKTTVGRREGSKPGPTRQRHFRLTEVALEYFHLFSHVKVKCSFPLTSIEKIEYDEANKPTTFRLVFANCIEVLQAETAEEANDWVEKIVEACKKWHAPPTEESFDESEEERKSAYPLELTEDDHSSHASNIGVIESDREKVHDKYRSSVVKVRQRSFTSPLVMSRDREQVKDEHIIFTTGPRNENLIARRDRSSTLTASSALSLTSDTQRKDEFRSPFPMIKYPRHMLGIPSEKWFKLDANNMQIMWRRNHHSKFHRSRSLSLHKVVEVREGQNTEMFDKFPYEQVEKQSFSLIYQQEDKRYAYLTSLNLICDRPENYKLWISELKSKLAGQSSSCNHPRLSNVDNDATDATILWLKQIWSCKSDRGELSAKQAVKLAKKLNPFITDQHAKRIVSDAYEHQVESTHGLSLGFNGFVLMFNLLGDLTNNSVYSVFKEYAKTHLHLGMTFREFQEFLIKECGWVRTSCTRSALRKLMKFHDLYHNAYKKYTANNRPSDFVASKKLLSFAGFLSFLRSKDNSVIDIEHETVYQDMTQPLSHYFINSSHNTYLDGHQLNGKSSTDAYTRVLLQGCRCIEIDCWNDTLNVMNLPEKEPIITHGYTLTTKLRFRDVIHTIKDYAFQTSPYPIIISIENHCDKAHQAKMALIFRAIFGEMLPQEDLVEVKGRDRLPSPEDLQRKIILKSSVKESEPAKSKTPTTRKALKLSHSEPTFSKTLSQTDSSHKTTTAAVNTKHSKTMPTRSQNTATTSLSVLEESDGFDGKLTKGTLSRSLRHKKLGDIKKVVEELEHGQDDQEVEFIETVDDLSSLIIYAKCKHIKPWNWEEQKKTKVTQLFSFGEPTADKLCDEDHREMLAATERQLVRTYPRGTRFDSSNYDPFNMWKCGIQMVTLNFQTGDTYMHLNRGFFRRNGGCGYILKPAVMRKEDPGGGSTPFDPKMQEPHPDVPPIEFEIELISGQRLCAWKKKCSTVAVLLQTYGILHDCESITEATHDNVLWPHWKKGKHILKKTLYMPEVCLVYFRVETDRKLFGQNCFPVISLQPGIKFIPMRTPGGELIPSSGLFVKIRKTCATFGRTCTTDHETDECGSINDRLRPFLQQISRQQAFDHDNNIGLDENHEIGEAAEPKDEAENDKAEGKFPESKRKIDEEFQQASYRRFSSPATLDS